jgi:Ras-related protein Rab-6A
LFCCVTFGAGGCVVLAVLSTMATIKIPEQKVILCGEYGVGKSSLFRRFTNDTFVTATDRKSTLGLDHYAKTYRVSDRDLKVHPLNTPPASVTL